MEEKIYLAGSDRYNTIGQHVNAPLFTKVFDKTWSGDALLRISVSGFYRLFVNGHELTKGFFAPYISNPDDVVYCDEYPLRGLKRHKNVLCVLLGNGFANVNDNGLWDFDKAPFRAAPCFSLQIFAKDKCVLGTNESFRVCDSPILFDDLRCGEFYDARLEQPDLFAEGIPAFSRRPIRVAAPRGEERRCTADPIRAFERLRPVRILKGEREGVYIYDFGENNAGVCTLRIDGAAGQTVDLYFGEMLKGNALDQENISFGERSPRGYVQHDKYICRGGRAEYTPSFTYHGFRYVQAEGITPAQATEDLLEFVVLHSDVEQRGIFSCNGETAQRLQECTLRSDLSNFFYFPTDCPQREKNGWTGDAALSAEQLLYNFDVSRSLREWLFQVRKAQRADGMLPGIVPTAGWGYAWGNGPAWDCVLFEVPYQIYRFTGDKTVIEENADAMLSYVRYLQKKLNRDGLAEYGLGDWCEAGAFSEDAYSTPLEVTDSLICIDLLHKCAFLLKEIQRGEAKDVSLLCDTLRGNFRKKYILGSVSLQTQTALALALAFGVFDREEIADAYARLTELIHAENDHFKVGVLGGRHLFEVLSEHSDTELAYKLIVQESFPSYGYNLSFGATTLFEGFQKFTGDMRREDGGERILSQNHHFWGFISAWFYEKLAGLNIVSARHAKISPHCIPQLMRAGAEFYDGEAFIRVRWARRGETVVLTVENGGFCAELVREGASIPLPQGVSKYVLSRS